MKKLLLIALLIVGCDNSINTSEPKEDSINTDEVVPDNDIEPEENCEVCDVAYLITDDFMYNDGTYAFKRLLYWTEGFKPAMIQDTIMFDFPDCIPPCYLITSGPYIIDNDTIFSVPDSVISITHFVEPNYFDLTWISWGNVYSEGDTSWMEFYINQENSDIEWSNFYKIKEKRLYPNDFEIFKYKYK